MNIVEPRLTVRVLGHPQVRWGEDVLKVPTRKSLAILCYLAMRGEGVLRDELAELLWAPGGAANLRPELHRLRSLPGADTWLSTDGLVSADAGTDLASFEKAVADERFGEALALFPPSTVLLHGLEPRAAPAFSDWLDSERNRMVALQCDALRGQARQLEDEDSVFDAIDLTRQLLLLDPLDESAYRTAMRLEYMRGNVQAALHIFEQCRRVLKEELDVSPLDETARFAATIGRSDELLKPPLAPKRRQMPVHLLRPPVLVGRESEWLRLETAWEAKHAINISGPPGIGKSRLMLDFARSKGSYFLLQGRPGDKAVPYSSLSRGVREALNLFPDLVSAAEPWVGAELSRILPGIFPAAPQAPGSDEGENRLFEALFTVLALLGQRISALLVDDLQFLDAKSFEVGLAAQSRLLTDRTAFGEARLIAVFRKGTLPAPFEAGLALAVEFGIVAHLELQPLDPTSVQELLDSLDVEASTGLGPRLRRLTGGNPQFIVEALKHMLQAGRPEAELSESSGLPEGLVLLIKGRLAGLSAPAFHLAQALAVLAEPTGQEVLAEALQMSALEIAESLAELEVAQIFDGQEFAHDLLREAVISHTSEATRKLLHRRIASTLDRAGADLARVAHHWIAAESADSSGESTRPRGRSS